MADELEVPDNPESLVLAAGEEVNANRPLYTGDVISDVSLPVLQPEPLTIAVLSHPCSMRNGAALQEYLHVAPVVAHSEFGRQMWRGNYSRMALDAISEAVDLVNPIIRLDRMSLVESNSLDLRQRVACLDRYGVNVLSQRLVHFFTRTTIAVARFDKQSVGAHEEIDLMEEWIDAADAAGTSADAATDSFHDWIRADGRQQKLSDPQMISTIRRQLRTELAEMYPQ